jgi:hypothetical protein
MKIYCEECGGTGLYSGRFEVCGAAVICHNCDGTGAVEYEPPEVVEFAGLRLRDDVTHISLPDSGRALVPEIDVNAISYEEFLNGKRPGKVEINRRHRYCRMTLSEVCNERRK